jgi:H+/gluconate symporter-like permease
MIVIIGLVLLIAAAGVAVAGVAANSGTAHPLGDDFTVLGLHLSGLSTGQLFLYGIVVGVVGMLGLSMLLGAFSRRTASRESRRELKESRRETTAARRDRDELARQLDDERAEHQPVEASRHPPVQASSTVDPSSAADTGQGPPPG